MVSGKKIGPCPRAHLGIPLKNKLPTESLLMDLVRTASLKFHTSYPLTGWAPFV